MVSEKLAEASAASSNAVSEAATVERTRISAIMGLDLYKGREAAAQKCIDMGMSAKDSEEFLSAVPVVNDTKAENKPAENGEAQKKVLEQLAAESPDVQPTASVATGGAELSEQEKFEQDAIASAKSFGAVRGRRKNS